MSISRRSLLQGMAAAPLAAAAGPALLAGTASAAPAALADHPFRLEQRVRPDWAT